MTELSHNQQVAYKSTGASQSVSSGLAQPSLAENHYGSSYGYHQQSSSLMSSDYGATGQHGYGGSDSHGYGVAFGSASASNQAAAQNKLYQSAATASSAADKQQQSYNPAAAAAMSQAYNSAGAYQTDPTTLAYHQSAMGYQSGQQPTSAGAATAYQGASLSASYQGSQIGGGSYETGHQQQQQPGSVYGSGGGASQALYRLRDGQSSYDAATAGILDRSGSQSGNTVTYPGGQSTQSLSSSTGKMIDSMNKLMVKEPATTMPVTSHDASGVGASLTTVTNTTSSTSISLSTTTSSLVTSATSKATSLPSTTKSTVLSTSLYIRNHFIFI